MVFITCGTNVSVSRGHTQFHKTGKASVNFCCCTGIYLLALRNIICLTDKAAACGFPVDLHLAIYYYSYDNSTHVAEHCTVIGPPLYKAVNCKRSY